MSSHSDPATAHNFELDILHKLLFQPDGVILWASQIWERFQLYSCSVASQITLSVYKLHVRVSNEIVHAVLCSLYWSWYGLPQAL